MATAVVVSGGGSLGAVPTGTLQALTSRGVEPGLLVGTSTGALNAADVTLQVRVVTGSATIDIAHRVPHRCPLTIALGELR